MDSSTKIRNRYSEVNPYEVCMQTIDLHAKEYALHKKIDLRTLARHSHFNEHKDNIKQEMLLELHTYIYGYNHQDEHIISYPENWWEAVKERFAPAWFRDRYPVRFSTHTATLEETFPNIEPMEKGSVMRMNILKTSSTPIW